MATILPRPPCVNALWPSDAVWHQTSWSTMVHSMAFCLFGAKSSLNPMLIYCQLKPDKRLFQGNLNQNEKKKSIRKSTFENILCKLSTIFYRHQCLNSSPHSDTICHQAITWTNVNSRWLASIPVQFHRKCARYSNLFYHLKQNFETHLYICQRTMS